MAGLPLQATIQLYVIYAIVAVNSVLNNPAVLQTSVSVLGHKTCHNTHIHGGQKKLLHDQTIRLSAQRTNNLTVNTHILFAILFSTIQSVYKSNKENRQKPQFHNR